MTSHLSQLLISGNFYLFLCRVYSYLLVFYVTSCQQSTSLQIKFIYSKDFERPTSPVFSVHYPAHMCTKTEQVSICNVSYCTISSLIINYHRYTLVAESHCAQTELSLSIQVI